MQVYNGGTPLEEAATRMSQERSLLRDQPGDIISEAARLGKAATPPISLIFDITRELAYTAARNELGASFRLD